MTVGGCSVEYEYILLRQCRIPAFYRFVRHCASTPSCRENFRLSHNLMDWSIEFLIRWRLSPCVWVCVHNKLLEGSLVNPSNVEVILTALRNSQHGSKQLFYHYSQHILYTHFRMRWPLLSIPTRDSWQTQCLIKCLSLLQQYVPIALFSFLSHASSLPTAAS